MLLLVISISLLILIGLGISKLLHFRKIKHLQTLEYIFKCFSCNRIVRFDTPLTTCPDPILHSHLRLLIRLTKCEKHTFTVCIVNTHKLPDNRK